MRRGTLVCHSRKHRVPPLPLHLIMWPRKKEPTKWGLLFEVKGFIPRPNWENFVNTINNMKVVNVNSDYRLRGYVREISNYIYKIYIEGEWIPLEKTKHAIMRYEDFNQPETIIVVKDLRELKRYTFDEFTLKPQMFVYQPRPFRKKEYCLACCQKEDNESIHEEAVRAKEYPAVLLKRNMSLYKTNISQSVMHGANSEHHQK